MKKIICILGLFVLLGCSGGSNKKEIPCTRESWSWVKGKEVEVLGITTSWYNPNENRTYIRELGDDTIRVIPNVPQYVLIGLNKGDTIKYD
jgi:hypothetical protein